ncbi:MAG: FAD-dependent monooxygenase [Planctomycetota bacterium]
MSDPLPDCEVAVIGAGPAGSVLARELALRGRAVTLIERTTFPRRKVCGGCLSGHAVRELTAAGLIDSVKTAGAIPQTGFRLGVAGPSRREAFVKTAGGLALSRARFDAVLAEQATAAGATLHFGTTAKFSKGGPLRLSGAVKGELSAQVVVLACGLSGAGRDRPSLRP